MTDEAKFQAQQADQQHDQAAWQAQQQGQDQQPQTHNESRLQEIENSLANVQVSSELTQGSHGFGSPAGDIALPYLDKAFSQLNEYLTLKLPDGIAKTLVLAQIKYLYLLVRTAAQHALT